MSSQWISCSRHEVYVKQFQIVFRDPAFLPYFREKSRGTEVTLRLQFWFRLIHHKTFPNMYQCSRSGLD